MGDTRFDRVLDRLEEAADRADAVKRLSHEELVQAMGALAKEADAFLANILATEALNRARGATALLESVPEGVVSLDHEGRIRYTNPAALELLRQEPGALRRRPFHEAVGHETRAGTHASDTCPVLDALRTGRPHVSDPTAQHTFERGDGTRFLVEFGAAPILAQDVVIGAAVVFRDVTREREHDAYRTLSIAALDEVGEGVFWIEEDGRLLYANRAAVDHLGMTHAQLMDARVYDFAKRFDASTWRAHWAALRKKKRAAYATTHVRADGTELPVHVDVTLVEHEGREFHVAIVRPRAPDETREKGA